MQLRARGGVEAVIPPSARALIDRCAPGVMTPESFAKSQAYARDCSRFSFVYDTILTLCLLVFVFFGLSFTWKWSVFISCAVTGDESHTIITSLIFVGLVSLVYYIIYLPFGIYEVFVIEVRHGFNNTTPKLFFTTQLIAICLSLLIGAPVITFLLKIVEWTGQYFWFYTWIFTVVFTLLSTAISPYIVIPLFYEVKELEDGELRNAVREMCIKVKFSLSRLLVLNESKRSSHSNAALLGLFNTKQILLFDTLLENLSVNEILSVLGHEMGHHVYYHTYKNIVLTETYFFVLLFGLSKIVTTPSIFIAFGFESQPLIIGLLLFSVVFMPVHCLFLFCMNFVSRRFEYNADLFSVSKFGYDLKGSLVKLHQQNLISVVNDPLYSIYHNSHPSLIERLEALETGDFSTEHKYTEAP
ncbi:Ste24 endopeptidase [Pelomyxa schiedti]|nr:Ste24 endopeptidase [Pelomyxa schiedti]